VAGPESSGKTSLCAALNARYHWPVIEDLSRTMAPENPLIYRAEHVEKISRAYHARERWSRESGLPVFLSDTEWLNLILWFEFKGWKVPGWIEDEWIQSGPRLYLLCKPDIPWEEDPLREMPDQDKRYALFDAYRKRLEQSDIPWTVIEGSAEQRVKDAEIRLAEWLGIAGFGTLSSRI
jgi:nicotinamide riboside kinase